MSNESDIQAKEQEISRLSDGIFDNSQQVQSNNEKIARLEGVEHILELQRDHTEATEKQFKKHSEDRDNFGDWYGAEYGRTLEHMAAIDSQYSAFTNGIDQTLDDVRRYIQDLKIKNRKLNNDCTWFEELISNLKSEIEILLN